MRQHLLIDADDTLWENNIYFEQAIHAFITFLNHSRLTHEEVRVVLDDIERHMGYGSVNFTKSLVETYRRLVEGELRDEDVRLGEFREQFTALEPDTLPALVRPASTMPWLPCFLNLRPTGSEKVALAVIVSVPVTSALLS